MKKTLETERLNSLIYWTNLFSIITRKEEVAKQTAQMNAVSKVVSWDEWTTKQPPQDWVIKRRKKKQNPIELEESVSIAGGFNSLLSSKILSYAGRLSVPQKQRYSSVKWGFWPLIAIYEAQITAKHTWHWIAAENPQIMVICLMNKFVPPKDHWTLMCCLQRFCSVQDCIFIMPQACLVNPFRLMLCVSLLNTSVTGRVQSSHCASGSKQYRWASAERARNNGRRRQWDAQLLMMKK